MKKIFALALVVALVGTMIFSAVAFGKGFGGPGNGEYRGGMGFFNQTGLNLTLEQKQKILAIRQKFQKETLDLRFDLQKKQLELNELWAASPVDQAAIDAKNKEVTGLKIRLREKAKAMQESIKKVLTPEQLKIWEKRGQRGPGFGMGRRGGCGGCK